MTVTSASAGTTTGMEPLPNLTLSYDGIMDAVWSGLDGLRDLARSSRPRHMKPSWFAPGRRRQACEQRLEDQALSTNRRMQAVREVEVLIHPFPEDVP